MAQLLSSFGKKGVSLGLATQKIDIEDTDYLSKYFVISEFNPVFTAGKNSVAFNGSPLLKPGAEISIECVDSNGNSLFIETPISKTTQFSDASKFVIAVHIYNEAYNGAGKLTFVGTTSKNEIVRWTGNITIDKTLQNISTVRFYTKPTIEARALLYPIIAGDIGTGLSKQIEFSGSFYTYAATPKKDTKQSSINPKQNDIDYRLVYTTPIDESAPKTYPTTSFNSQMEGQTITLYANLIQLPYSYQEISPNITSSFKIKKVVDEKTLELDNAFFYPFSTDSIITHITDGFLTSSYKMILYNTQSDSYQKYTPPGLSTFFIKESWAEIVYRNIRPFSGFIARHKLYKRSLLYPGDFQLVSDEPLGSSEILIDQITNNKSYALMGVFYNQLHINKYWFTSSANLFLSHSVSPRINSMEIGADTFDHADGTAYVMLQTDSPGVTNFSASYTPFNADEFNHQSGISYNSNFIDLKKNSQYVLSMNLIVEKDKFNENANVSFYFTSSIESIQKEKNFVQPFGLKLGEIDITDDTDLKIYNDPQVFFFTPNDDYFGTLVIVPFQCNVTLSNLSLKVYGDYGFSPDILFTRIPFKVNAANEIFEIKAELFDINSTLVFSDLRTVQSFDSDGESLFVFVGDTNMDPSKVSFISGSLTVSGSLFLPNIRGCPPEGITLLGYHTPTQFPPGNLDGEVCFTNISLNLLNDYINVVTTPPTEPPNPTPPSVTKSALIVQNTGKKIIVLDAP